MKKANNLGFTAEELAAHLRGTSLPTLVVEGRTDMEFYRKIEELCFDYSIDIIPAGCKNTLIEVFKRRSEFTKTNIAFLADSDIFCLSAPPTELDGIVFTHGYSIENDILSGGKAIRQIPKAHRKKWEQILAAIVRWFESALSKNVRGQAIEYKIHPAKIIDFSSGEYHQDALSTIEGDEAIPENLKKIRQCPIKFLRGHTLIDTLGHYLSQVKAEPKFSKQMLLHIDLLSWDSNSALQALVTRIRSKVE